MNLPKIGQKEIVYQNKYQLTYKVDAEFDDFTKQYFVNETGVKSGIVVIRNDRSILLVRQYRLLINDLSWEIPGGRVEGGESPQAAAIRECMEETGVKCLDATPLIFYQQGLDTFSCPTHVFYTDCIKEPDQLQGIDPRETSSCEWIPLSRCIDMISKEEILDSFTILSILAYCAFVQE